MGLPTPRPWPVPVPQWFWPWAGWRLAGARGPRPPAPHKIPAWAWVRLSYMKARPVAPQGKTVPWPFNGRGMFLLEPTGGTEDVARWKQAGGTYLLLNIAPVSGGDWHVHRKRAKECGLIVVPWQRVRTIEDAIDVELAADAWNSPACAHNLETEAMTTLPPELLGRVTDPFPTARVRAVITEPWMQNSAGWQHLGRRGWVAMPEAFLNANPAWDPTVVCSHAKTEGMPLAVPAFGWGKWKDAPTYVAPGHYLSRWSGPFAVYPGDGKEGSYREWAR